MNNKDTLMQKEIDERYMRCAIELAKRGAGYTSPNPMVGAVIVKDENVIGEGCHERFGELHAERNALKNCLESGNDPSGSTVYVTLEPCCHYGKTPPCTDALIEAKVARVVIGSSDPNPLVSGKGVQILLDAGIEVTQDILREECDAVNRVFFHYITTGTPYVIMKYAMTLDGKIATVSGKSQWISGEDAREKVHKDRGRYSAVMVGIGTVLADDPLLTCRTAGGKNPTRIICDTSLRLPFNSRIVMTAKEVPTIIATAVSDKEKLSPYKEAACEIITVEKSAHGFLGIDLSALMKKLGERSIDSVILEGGATLNASALKSGIVNRVQAYIAPKIFGGANAKGPVAGPGVESPDEAYRFGPPVVSRAGNDILLECEVIKCSQES